MVTVGSSPSIRAGSVEAWLLASRPKTLSAAAVPVVVGSACAAATGAVRWPAGLAALGGALLLQIGANFANDVFDHERGADTAERLGPTRAVQAGLIDAAQMRRGMWFVFALALGFGVYLTLVAGPLILLIGLLSIASAIAYTGGPYPLGYHGLGDVFVFLFFGVIAVCGTAFVELGRMPWLSLWAALPVGALATAILVVNNLRDRETDARAGKRTLAVRFGRTGALAEYRALLLLSYAVPVALLVSASAGAFVLLPLLSAPLALRLERSVSRGEGRALNPLLGRTAGLLLAYGVLFALGLSAPAWLGSGWKP
ncbi:MAG TPA: 1,4-dihydroxy-2-naphthoate polyprenyltransferase [Polyangiaceae bacterium]|jgi:1,4-dihydroxy-2-naphthoate octaprenyltransferase